MFVFDAFTTEQTELEFPITGGFQVTTSGGVLAMPVYAVALSEMVRDGSFTCIEQVVSMRQIDTRLEPALLALESKLEYRTHNEPTSVSNGEHEFMFNEPVEFLGHAGIIRVALYYRSGL
jgi:hypothetical protein